MKKFLGSLMLLVALGWCIPDALAQTQRRRKSNSVNSNSRSVATTGARTGRGRYVTRNGKRIWVPQGSPALNRNSNSSPRRVVEREQLEVRKKPSTNTNRP